MPGTDASTRYLQVLRAVVQRSACADDGCTLRLLLHAHGELGVDILHQRLGLPIQRHSVSTEHLATVGHQVVTDEVAAWVELCHRGQASTLMAVPAV